MGPGILKKYAKTGRFKMRYKYLVIIEKTPTGYSAYSPDLPGCAAFGATKKELSQNMRQAIRFHIEGLQLVNEPVPPSSSHTAYLSVTA